MDEIKLAFKSSDEHGAQETMPQMYNVPELYNQILQLLNAKFSDHSLMVLQEELRLMQRSSYFLEIQRDDLLPSEQLQQHTLHLSDSTVWSLIDQRRLQRAMALAHGQVKLLLSLLAMLCQEIIGGCRQLEAFILQCDQGSVDSDMAASTQQTLQQTLQYRKDFEDRMTRNLGPLDLDNQLIPNTGNFPIPQLSASLAIKMPVVFERNASRTTSDTVHLSWQVAGSHSKEPNQQFEIHVKSLHPTSLEHGHFTKSTCQSYNILVNSLLPDRFYQFSVKRVDSVNLVYGLWVDTIVLKTLDK